MRITFVLPFAGLSGGTRVVAIYAERLQRLGHSVFVVSLPEPTTPFRRRMKSALLGRGWPLVEREPSHFDHVHVPHRVIERRRPVVDQDVPEADVVIATWWETAEWVARLSASKGAKAYFIQHHEVHEGLPKDRVRATWRLPLHKITISGWLVDLARTAYGDRFVDLVPNSVDLDQFNAPPRTRQSRFTLGFLFSTSETKGCDVISRAIDAVRGQIAGARILVFGTERPSGPGTVPEGTEFYFRPRQDLIRDIYRQCDGWLFGSRFEGFGLPILEAMACRTPVIGTATGAAPELLGAGGGILVDVEDSDSMAAAIRRLYQLDQYAWRAMSDAAYRTATRYTWDDATILMEAALRRTIERTQSGELTSRIPETTVAR